MNPPLDKRTLAKIVAEAHRRYLANGYSDGKQYLDPKEILARAYTEAAIAVLHAQGYRLTTVKREDET